MNLNHLNTLTGIHHLHKQLEILGNLKRKKMDIKQYLHYYIGQNVFDSVDNRINKLVGITDEGVKLRYERSFLFEREFFEVKLIVRRLSDITEQEKTESCISTIHEGVVLFHSFHYLIQKGYWLFGNEAFEQGLIIDAKTV